MIFDLFLEGIPEIYIYIYRQKNLILLNLVLNGSHKRGTCILYYCLLYIHNENTCAFLQIVSSDGSCEFLVTYFILN